MLHKLRTQFTDLCHKYFQKGVTPHWIILLMDCAIVVLSGITSHIFDIGIIGTFNHLPLILLTWCFYCIFFLIGFKWQRTYSGVLRYSSFIDLAHIVLANIIGVVCIFAVRHSTPIDDYLMPIPHTSLCAIFFIATFYMWGIRVLVKYLYDLFYVSPVIKKVFIYGVHEGGMALAKSLHSEESKYLVKGFVSDDKKDANHILMGVKVYPNDENLIAVMRAYGAKTLMVSPIKTNDLRDNQDMVDMLTNAGIAILIYGQSTEWNGNSEISHAHLKEVDIEDLLPRNQIEIDLDKISNVLKDKCILITGAAGSIGSEIVKQVAEFKPSQMVLIDQAETPLHDIRLFMANNYTYIPCETITASICHGTHMQAIFKKYRPEYVFHAAAYKHVPMMEDNPAEAVLNNIRGTRIIADLAVKYGTKKFVMVSTDKAVNPTNVMGCSKRICEMYCQALDKKLKEEYEEAPSTTQMPTQFVTTRFGNVLGSNGSVIPIFKRQIQAGGPLTVTHPDIIRYFMLIPEACQLVLQAGVMGHGSEVFVFDMGKPVKIADLAKRMILLSGANDIQIKYTGLRDGEKLYEELLNKEENTKPSSHPKIKLAEVREVSYEEVKDQIDKLIRTTKADYDDMEIVQQMKIIVPEFKSKHSKYEALD
ncbi:MAG: polysaccharide biosynthesis protein [Bacteroidaceae bacterium]|nr:polysaccharide biosynthesis protein [Bacteroidaceae bacterium]